MEGRKISQKYNARGSQVGDLLNPVRGYRDTLVRKGVMPRDHARDNARQLREMQANNRVRKQQQQEAARHTKKFTLKQFRGVSSRFRDGGAADGASVSGGASAAAPRKTHEFVRKGQGRGGTPQKKTRPGRGRKENNRRSTGDAGGGGGSGVGGGPRRGGGARKAALPATAGVIAPRSSVNYVRQNQADADASAPPLRAGGGGRGAAAGGVGKRDYGKVPTYLKERRAELEAAAEERRRNMPDEDCPPGMTMLPEEERVSTLAILTKSLAECKKQLGQMPLLIETHGQRKRQEALDDKMRELEEAIKIFGRDKVFVREDE